MDRERCRVSIFVVAASASVYALTALIADGWAPVVGFSRIRPALGLPLAFTLVFGPVAAGGMAAGVIVNDLVRGTLTATSFVDSLGVLALGWTGFAVSRQATVRSVSESRIETVANYAFGTLVAATGSAAVVAWGGTLLGSTPFFLAAIRWFVSAFLASLVVGFPTLLLLTRVEWPRHRGPSGRRNVSRIAAVALGWFVLGTVGSLGIAALSAIPPASLAKHLSEAVGHNKHALLRLGWWVQVGLGVIGFAILVRHTAFAD